MAILRCRCRRFRRWPRCSTSRGSQAYPDEESWTRQDEISGLIAQALKGATTAQWVARMEPLKIWHAPVQGYAEIVADPQVKHMQSLVTVPGAGDDQRASAPW